MCAFFVIECPCIDMFVHRPCYFRLSEKFCLVCSKEQKQVLDLCVEVLANSVPLFTLYFQSVPGRVFGGAVLGVLPSAVWWSGRVVQFRRTPTWVSLTGNKLYQLGVFVRQPLNVIIEHHFLLYLNWIHVSHPSCIAETCQMNLFTLAMVMGTNDLYHVYLFQCPWPCLQVIRSAESKICFVYLLAQFSAIKHEMVSGVGAL